MNLLRPWFADPWLLSVLVVLPVLGILAWWGRRRRRRKLLQLGWLPALVGLTERGREWRKLRLFCWTWGLILLIVGSAGPQWGIDPERATAPGRDVVVVLDVSRSMLGQDVPPNRQEQARQALNDLADALRQRGGHRLGLVAFAHRALVVCPLTNDYNYFQEKLAELDAAFPPPDVRPTRRGLASGTRIGAGIQAAVALLGDEHFRPFQDVLLISDGDDPGRDGEWAIGIAAASQEKVPVHVIGVGDPERDGVPIPVGDEMVLTRYQEEPLREIARQTGGLYLAPSGAAPPLGEWFQRHLEPKIGRDHTEDVLPLYRQRYPWFLGGALLLLVAEVLLSRRWPMRNREISGQKSAFSVRAVGALAPLQQ
ncbi:MAG: vWA domain-containing protein [Gemmataceae bacterium]